MFQVLPCDPRRLPTARYEFKGMRFRCGLQRSVTWIAAILIDAVAGGEPHPQSLRIEYRGHQQGNSSCMRRPDGAVGPVARCSSSSMIRPMCFSLAHASAT